MHTSKIWALEAEMATQTGYKASELGMIPLDWDIVEFEEICQIRKQKVNPLFQSGEFCVELEHLEPETGLLLGNTVTKPNSSIKTVFQNGDVLFGKLRAYLRKYWLANQDGVCSTEIWAFVATNKAINPFLFYVVQTEQFIKAASEAYGTHMPRSDWNVVKNYLLPLPPLPEQTAIATALSDTDALISSLQTLIAKKQAVKLAAMQNLLSGKIRLPAFAQRPDGSLKTTRQTELGCVPEDWEVLELGSVAFIKTGSKNNQDKKENGQYPFFVRSATVEQIDTYSYDCEAILIPGEGNIGSIFHYINGKFDAHQRVYVIRDFYNVIGKFVFFALKQNFGKHAMENTVKATVDSLRLPTFQNFKFAIPKSTTEQTAIAQLLSDMDAEIEALEGRLKKTQSLKQGMMQTLLTGKIRLPLE
ncbi:restriction endonuclease subunit S [Neisseria mucosa]|uniref:restriction endonuclease subunit S n=1 Tax=Neisseria mucosa TaxID=488 RepID=UPI002551757F|nr:restriction endonuclease subunit S [Neisseria mucosa]MDK6727313.1 restriction endonuclease subunit S [Neisseria mucosa]MDK8111293.1 restriction endonuclease subunit S [Neisseria mucosa]